MRVVRPMEPGDVPAVGELEKKIFSQPWSCQGFLDSLALSETIFLVACEAQKVVGYIGMYSSLDEGEIVNVAVAPDARRMGTGDALIGEMLNCAAERGIRQIALEVRVSNEAAIRLYEKHGFVRCGVRRGFYELPREDAYIMIYGQEFPL